MKIAIVLNLDWPLKRIHKMYAGIKSYAEKHTDWSITWDPYPELLMKASPTAYDGIIGRCKLGTVETAQELNVPLINTWCSNNIPGLSSVFPDYFKAGELAAETMAKRGYTNFVSINYKFKAAKLFLKGVDSVLKVRKYSHKKHFLSREMEKNIQKWQAVHQDFASWVKEWDLPVAILSGISDLGPKISALCNANNIRIPEDVALLTSGNDLAYCEGISPTISSVDINFFEVGFQAARMLDFKIQNIPLENETTLVPSSGIAYRESTCHLVFADSIIRKAISFIADNYQKNIQIRDVVSNSQVSRRSLEQRFKDTVGHTIHEEIARLRLETMKLLLLQTRKSIKILSSEAGFSNVNHMRRAFLKATGVLPKEFRDADKLR